MDKEAGREFLARVSEYLLSLPFDLKVLVEAVSDPELERPARELAAGVVIHALGPHEGGGPDAFIEDVMLLRVALQEIVQQGGDGAAAFRARFAEIYERLEDDLQLFSRSLGAELWTWLSRRISGFGKLAHKGKRAARYVEDVEAQELLYEDCLSFQTNYSLTEAQVHNRLRRPEVLSEHLSRRHAEDLKRRVG